MSRKTKAAIATFIGLALCAAAVIYFRNTSIPVLQPRGPVAGQERALMYTGLLLSVIVVIPVYALTIGISRKYRASNKKARYQPDWEHNRLIELVWWGIPGIIILVLSIITWNSAHALDPFKSLSGSHSTLNIQVVSLDWKWLFIYPDQGVASVNYLKFPINTQLNMNITSDSVMNSFWLPALGGQIYSMPGMSTQLHLLSDKEGTYKGSSANISGRGFAGMAFTAQAVSGDDFAKWTKSVRASSKPLSANSYQMLAHPSSNYPTTTYSSVEPGLYNSILLKYMPPASRTNAELHGSAGGR